jgi:hypothetical protein
MDEAIAQQEVDRLRAEAERTKLLASPHVIYGARVWKTNLTEEGKTWACGLVYEGSFPPYCGTVQVQTEGYSFWGTAYPVAFGSTPALACEAFDSLWVTGE